MKEGWTYKKLGEIATYINGFPFKPSDWKDVGKPIIRIQNLTNPQSGFNRCSRTDIPEKYSVIKGDVLISWSATLGVFEWESEDALLNQHIFKVVFDKVDIDKQFFKYAVLMSIAEMAKHTNGATMKHIRKGDFDNINIPYPPLSEQQSIVDYLDSAFAKIDAMKANAEKALGEAKALFQASLKEMMEPKEGIKWRTVGEIFETYSGGTPTKSNKDYYEGGTIPWLRSGEVCQKDIIETEMFITEKGLKESSAKYYPENTVVVAMYGATAAQVGILRIKATSNQAVCGILPHKDFLPEYVYYWFSSIEDKLAAQAQGGAQPNISQQKIKKVEIPIYSITDQQSIVETLDTLKSKVDRLQENFDKISQECDALKQAILRQVFE